jgi:quinohemoprotein ethanol dehydrogenase
MSYNPQTGLAYLPTIHHAVEYDDSGIEENWRTEVFKGGTAVDWVDNIPQPRPYGGSLQAWDPVEQRAVWSVPQQDTWNAGTLTTAGNLVFQGRSDGTFIAYDARTGELVWSYELGLGISAPPITYKIDGKQYVSLLVGYGGGAASKIGNRDARLGWAYGVHTRRLVSFALDADTQLPPQPAPSFPVPLVDVDFKIEGALAENGERHYVNLGCMGCHGRDVAGAGMAPDLKASAIFTDPAAFEAVVRGGARTTRAMPALADITDQELLELRHYIRQQALLAAGSVEGNKNKIHSK